MLRQTVEVLHDRFDHYSWVGIYLVEEGDLVLGPWKGPQATDHVRIPIGQGVCGAAAASGMTEVVDDVEADERYLSCFPSTRSEIVVPIVYEGKVVGEIDIDSDTPGCLRARGQGAPRTRRGAHLPAQPRRLGHPRRAVAGLSVAVLLTNARPFLRPQPSRLLRTLHCLTGCAIGEILGLVIATALGWGNAASIAIAVVLAFIFGYSFTLVPAPSRRHRARRPRSALRSPRTRSRSS